MSANPAAVNSQRSLDSLVANEFVFEINDESVTGIFTIVGLVTLSLELQADGSVKKANTPFTVSKMVQRDPRNPFNTWIRETFAAVDQRERPTRTLKIVAVDNGQPIREWTINEAWISGIQYSDFDSGSGEMVEESVTIHYGSLDENWPLLNE